MTELDRGDRLIPLVLIGSVAAGLGLAATIPTVARELGPLVEVGVIALIFAVLLGIDLSGVGRAFGERRFLAVAVAINFVVTPLVAWGLGAAFLGNEPELWVGLILFLVTPCIGWYLIFTELAAGDATLGVSLLTVNIVLQFLLLPVYLWLFAGRVITLDISTIGTSVAIYLVVPLIGVLAVRGALRSTGRSVVELQAHPQLGRAKTAALVLVIVAMFASQGDVVFDNPGVVWQIGPPMACFFGGTFALSLVGARLTRLPYEQAALLVFTTTSRNSEASLAIAVTAFSSPLVALTVVIGPVIELPVLALMSRALLALRPRYDRRPNETRSSPAASGRVSIASKPAAANNETTASP